MRRYGLLADAVKKLALGSALLLLSFCTWAGHARISCSTNDTDIGTNWSDVSAPIPIPLPDIFTVGSALPQVIPGNFFECLVIASDRIQSVANGLTYPPVTVSPALFQINNLARSANNMLIRESHYINRQVRVFTADPNYSVYALDFRSNTPTVINPGDTLFTVRFVSDVALAGTSDSGFDVTIPFVAANRMVIQIPSCDFTSASYSVTLPDYTQIGTTPVAVPLGVICYQSQNSGTFSYTLTGNTVTGDNTIFSSDGTAQGIGVRFFKNSQPITVNQNVPFDYVSSNQTDLGLSVAYARTGAHLTAGTVQSRININITYN